MMFGIEEIKSITFGTDNIGEKDGYFVFSRFSDAEREVYSDEQDMFLRTYSTAGIKFDFLTDGRLLKFSYRLLAEFPNSMSFFDVYINDVFYDSLVGVSVNEVFNGEYTLSLPEGENRVTVYFSNLFTLQIKDFSIKNYTILKRPENDLSIVSYGDSITQGYNAVFPSYSYVNRIAKSFNANVYNKAIGDDVFRPALLKEKRIMDADIVTVAYGTNDWKHSTKERTETMVPIFFDTLDKEYKDSKIFIITPIWRKDNDLDVEFGPFDRITDFIQKESRKHSRFVCINGQEIFPHTVMLLSDGYLHPNDIGMQIYAENIINIIKKNI